MVAAPNNQYARKYDDAEIDKLCDELIEWAKKEKDIHIIGFAIKKDKVPSWLNWMADNYPKFKKAKDDARSILGYKILKTSFYDKNVNAYVGMQYIGIYDQDFREFMKYKAEIQKDIATKDQNKCIFNDELKKMKEEMPDD